MYHITNIHEGRALAISGKFLRNVCLSSSLTLLSTFAKIERHFPFSSAQDIVQWMRKLSIKFPFAKLLFSNWYLVPFSLKNLASSIPPSLLCMLTTGINAVKILDGIFLNRSSICAFAFWAEAIGVVEAWCKMRTSV